MNRKLPSTTSKGQAATSLPSLLMTNARTSVPLPNSSHHSFKYAGVWKKVPSGSATTRSPHPRARKAEASPVSSTRMGLAFEHEQRVMVGHQGRPLGSVRLDVHGLQIVLREHGQPFLHAAECHRRGNPVAEVQRLVPKNVERVIHPIERRVLDHDHSPAGEPGCFGQNLPLGLVWVGARTEGARRRKL